MPTEVVVAHPFANPLLFFLFPLKPARPIPTIPPDVCLFGDPLYSPFPFFVDRRRQFHRLREGSPSLRIVFGRVVYIGSRVGFWAPPPRDP